MGSGQKIGMTFFGAEDRHGGMPSWYLSGESRRVHLIGGCPKTADGFAPFSAPRGFPIR